MGEVPSGILVVSSASLSELSVTCEAGAYMYKELIHRPGTLFFEPALRIEDVAVRAEEVGIPVDDPETYVEGLPRTEYRSVNLSLLLAR